MNMPYLGEMAAVVTAGCWAACSLCFAYAGRRSDALAVNLARILLGWAILTAVHVALFGGVWPAVSANQATLLLVSGFIGLALGDLFLFHCLVCIGPRMGSLLMALAPAMTALLAWPVLGEAIGWQAGLGIAVVTAGVAFVVLDGTDGENWHAPEGQASRAWPVVCGALGALGQAVGLVLAKLGTAGGEGVAEVGPFQATVVRMAAGAVGTVLIALCMRRGFGLRQILRDSTARSMTFLGTIAGPVIGVWLSLVAVTKTDAGVAATLMGITPVLMIPISRVAYGARPGPRAISGTVVAVLGTALLFGESGG